jgi:hypothetical protein
MPAFDYINAPRGKILKQDQSDSTRPAPFAKIFLFARDPNHFTYRRRPVPSEGRLAIVTDAGRDAVDAEVLLTRALKRTAKTCGPDASTLASSLWKATSAGDGGKKARSPGRARNKP